jgi:hypothetical protein
LQKKPTAAAAFKFHVIENTVAMTLEKTKIGVSKVAHSISK